VAGASAGPYGNLHLAQTHNHASIPPLSCFTGQMPFLLPKQQHQSIEGSKLSGKQHAECLYNSVTA